MLGLTAACGGDRTVAPAAPSVSTAELPPGTIRREYTPPEQVGLWIRSDSLSAQRWELLANPMLDDYPMLRMAMTTTEEADVHRVLLPALRRLIAMSSLDGTAEATGGEAHGVRYSYKGQALLSVRFADARTPKPSLEGTRDRDVSAVAGAMAMMAVESGTMSLQDLALLAAGITAMQAEVADLTDHI
jgi:hypothetical protein